MKKLAAFAVVLLLGACVSNPYSLLPAGATSIGELQIDAEPGWNQLKTDSKKPPTAVWTCDGLMLDRMFVYAGVPDGETLAKEEHKSQALPRFHEGMLPNELVTFMEAYLGKMFGEGQALVESSNLRPQRYGSTDGIMFNVAITPAELARYKGTIGMFVANQKLYLIAYIAADPYYYDKHGKAAERMIASARL